MSAWNAPADLLFHGTSVYCLANILDVDRLDESAHWGKPGEPHGPRLSRSYAVASEFVQYNIHWGEGGVLVLDRKLLEADFEIVQYSDAMYGGSAWPTDEAEEVPLTSSIHALRRYLVSVVCDPEVIALAALPANLAAAREECGWGFSHQDDTLARESLARMSRNDLLNRWIPPQEFPRMGNWVTRVDASQTSMDEERTR